MQLLVEFHFHSNFHSKLELELDLATVGTNPELFSN